MTPALLAMTAIGIGFYPVISRAWGYDRDKFENRLQQAFDATLLFGGIVVSGFTAGASFLLGIISPDVLAAAPAFQLIMFASLFKAVAAVVGPVLYIVKAERLAITYFTVGIGIKAVAIALIAPRYGYMGAAWATLVVEVCLVFPATLAALSYRTGYRFSFGKAAQDTACNSNLNFLLYTDCDSPIHLWCDIWRHLLHAGIRAGCNFRNPICSNLLRATETVALPKLVYNDWHRRRRNKPSIVSVALS